MLGVPGVFVCLRSVSLLGRNHEGDLAFRRVSCEVFPHFCRRSPAEFFKMLGQFSSYADGAARL